MHKKSDTSIDVPLIFFLIRPKLGIQVNFAKASFILPKAFTKFSSDVA
jgi:hypothetical protein